MRNQPTVQLRLTSKKIDNENMSNADMIRLFLSTTVRHKNEIMDSIQNNARRLTSLEAGKQVSESKIESLELENKDPTQKAKDLKNNCETFRPLNSRSKAGWF